MTNLEICKRMAQIEGILRGILKAVTENNEMHARHCTVTGITNPYSIIDIADIYNPLTDKALCFDLMVKYNLSISKSLNGKYMCSTPNCVVTTINENPQMAICLAIIEAHNND